MALPILLNTRPTWHAGPVAFAGFAAPGLSGTDAEAWGCYHETPCTDRELCEARRYVDIHVTFTEFQ